MKAARRQGVRAGAAVSARDRRRAVQPRHRGSLQQELRRRGVTTACEYLADEGLIGKASTAVHLTRRSNVTVEELAFFYSEPPDDE